jgi:Kef-type K+ transport system membrane component KefB
MPDLSFSSLLIVSAAAFLAPFALGFFPGVQLPAVVLEIVLGIIVGPDGLGWATFDVPLQVLSVIGLAFLLFLAGLEIEFDRLRGRPLEIAALGFGLSFVIAMIVGYGLNAAGLGDTPLLVAIILTATSLGVLVPLLKDTGEISTSFGQLVIAAASIADFGAIILLSLFFSREATGIGTKLELLGLLMLFGAAVAVAIFGLEHVMGISQVLTRLQNTTAQIRIRAAFLLLAAFVALASELGLETILGAFIAGAVISLVDRDQMMTHADFRAKLEAVGFGVFIPIFFVTSGVKFDLNALFSGASTLARVPLFLLALLLARGLPALIYAPMIGNRRTAAACLMQATSLPFIVAATQIGVELGKLSQANAAALVAAGLLSVLIFPLAALSILRASSGAHVEAEGLGQPVGGGQL